jgi:molecular chaperone DnaK
LAKDEIDRMVREGQAHAAEDKARRDRVEARNEGDNAAYQAEKFIKDNGDKIPAEKKTDLQSKVSTVRSLLESEDPEAIKRATEELKTAFSAIGASMYQQPGNAAGDGAAPGADGGAGGDTGGEQNPPDGDVVDGEFREKK